MRMLIQRVSEARVEIRGKSVGAIDRGLLGLVGFCPDDGDSDLQWTLRKVSGLRIFPDEQRRMNRSLLDVDGGLLLVPQFTLLASTGRGMRPGFSLAAPPELARDLFARLTAAAGESVRSVQTGVFGADMQVHLINDGPVTFMLDSRQ